MAAVTKLADVLSALGISSSPAAEAGYLAAESVIERTCVWRQSDDQGNPLAPPAALVQAVILRTARDLARHTSPDGVVGVGEFGPVRVSAVDRDVEELEKPYRVVVFG